MNLVLQVIAWLSLPVLAMLAALIIWRKAVREFPYFFFYVALDEVVGLVRLAFYNPTSRLYFYTYWTTDVLIAVFAFLSSYELFMNRLFPRFHKIRFYRYLFPVAALITTLIAVPAALQVQKGLHLLAAIHVLEVLRVTVLIFFVALMIFMGRRWNRYELGIALGLGIQASAVLATSAIWARSPFAKNILNWLPVVAFDIACLIWMITFLKPKEQVVSLGDPMKPEVLTEVRKWEENLKDSITGKKRPN